MAQRGSRQCFQLVWGVWVSGALLNKPYTTRRRLVGSLVMRVRPQRMLQHACRERRTVFALCPPPSNYWTTQRPRTGLKQHPSLGMWQHWRKTEKRISIETCPGVTGSARSLSRPWGIAMETGEPRSTDFLIQQLSVAVQRGNCASVLGGMNAGLLLFYCLLNNKTIKVQHSCKIVKRKT